MTIPAVRGTWLTGTKLLSAELTTFDTNLATKATDKTGDSVLGAVSLNASMTVNGTLQGGVAVAPFVTASGGRIRHGDGDDIILTPARTRTITLSMFEYFYSYDGVGLAKSWNYDPSKFGISAASRGAGLSPLYLPLTRIHAGASLLSLTVFFRPQNQAFGTALPSVFPALDVLRLSPAIGGNATSLRLGGAVSFPSTTAANYQNPPATGSAGNVILSVNTGYTSTILNGALLSDTNGNAFQVASGGTYTNGALIPVNSTGTGAIMNHQATDVLTWSPRNVPTNAQPTSVVAAGGLTGGLDQGYAQSLTYVPDVVNNVIDPSQYTYLIKITDDNVAGPPGFTTYTGIRMVLGNITSQAFQ